VFEPAWFRSECNCDDAGMEVAESMVLVRLLPGVPRTMMGGEGDLWDRRGELLKVERLLVGLIGDFGKIKGCAQCGIFISTCLGLEPPELDEAKDCFRLGNGISVAIGECSGLNELYGVIGLKFIDLLGLSGAEGSTYRGMTIGTCFERGLDREGKCSKEKVGNNGKSNRASWSEESRGVEERAFPSRGTGR
jgi:hypothetical protein